MKIDVRCVALALLLAGCTAEKPAAPPPPTTTTAPTATIASTSTPATTTSGAPPDDQVAGTWPGQVKVGQPVSMFNYVGPESGDFAPMRFRNDSEAGKKILAVCKDDEECEFSGTVVWLDEPPPPDASAIGEIVRVDSVRRLPPAR